MKILKQAGKWVVAAVMGCVCTAALCSCSENDGEEDEYANWQPRNEQYFANAMLTTGDSIAKAKRVYGSDWEKYCNHRLYLCYSRQTSAEHKTTDSVAVEILKRGEEGKSPYTSDRVVIAYRTLLVPTSLHPTGLVVDHSGFSSEYDKVFDTATMSPSTFKVSELVKGVSTALLYMHKGDRWRVTIPADLAYGETASGDVPANSTVIFEMQLVEIYRNGTTPSDWQ
jgi:FKBP-type peptidyl-prolyl cis-trans isomerase FklB